MPIVFSFASMFSLKNKASSVVLNAVSFVSGIKNSKVTGYSNSCFRGNKPVLTDVTLKFLPRHERAEPFAYSKLAVSDVDKERLELFRPVRIEGPGLVPAGYVGQFSLCEWFLTLEMFAQELESFSLRDV